MSDWRRAAALGSDLVVDLETVGANARLIGAAGIAAHATGVTSIAIPTRDTKDIDLLCADRQQLRGALSFLAERGFAIHDQLYLATEGRRGAAVHPDYELPIDLVANPFSFAQVIDFSSRFDLHTPALGLTELLVTKLQRPRLRGADIGDILFILELADNIPNHRFDYSWLCELLAANWGLYYTIKSHLRDSLGKSPLPQAIADELLAAFESVPRSVCWVARSALGPRFRYYQLVD